MKAHLLLASLALAGVGYSSASAGQTRDSGQTERPRPISDAEARAEVRAKMAEGNRRFSEVLQRVTAALDQWKQGHRREGFTTMLIAHRDLNALLPREGERGETPAFHLTSGLYLAQMSDEMGEPGEAYELYYRIIHPPHRELEYFELRPDILLSYSELCTKLKKDKEAKWAFDQVAEGDVFTTYFWAADVASGRSRLDVAERWVRKALELRPDDKRAKRRLLILGNLKAKGKRSGIG